MDANNHTIKMQLPEDSSPGNYKAGPDLPGPQKTTGIIIAVAITLLIIGALYWLVTSTTNGTATAEPAPPEDWPAVSITPPTPTPTLTPNPLPPTPTPSPTPTPIVVGWRELGYLTSVQATLQTVAEVQRERVVLGIPITERVLLLAVGNVQAGIDMTAIKPEGAVVNGTSVKLTLPRAKVTSVELLPSETKIFDSQRSWFLSEYEGMEVEALNQARIQLEAWAVDRNAILPQAEKTARLQLTEFLSQLGFDTIEITFEE